jgi:hypothetical protein
MKGSAKMVYIIRTEHRGIKDVMLCATVGQNEQDFLRKVVVPKMRPLSTQEYINGPAAILYTAAHYCYVLHDKDVYWCVEWEPGLLVICFAPEGSMKWAAVRSRNPRFGGRKATEPEIRAFDEDAYDPQYHLIYDAWDEQFEERNRERWQVASSEIATDYIAALAPVNALHRELESGPTEFEKWRGRCKTSPIWKGDESPA